tara:strand:- start:758 stop:1888 length:1131 start_codon:yes stop_codon:yes gene_type:complete
MKILITGGAGFIGQATAKALIQKGHEVWLFDNLSPQIHGPKLLNGESLWGQLVVGDITNQSEVVRCLSERFDVVYHFAAETGTGQSMYKMADYFHVNCQGTIELLQAMSTLDVSARPKKLILASSRAVYGEGSYHCASDGLVFPEERVEQDLMKGDFELRCPVCEGKVDYVKTAEDAPYKPTSFYGLTKQIQEQNIQMFAKIYDVDIHILRYQNVYGPGQSLINPYTGILAIFSNLARSGAPINIFEDGKESRDFVFIGDVVHANVACLFSEDSSGLAINVGFGKSTSVLAVAKTINAYFGNKSKLEISGSYRVGDIRHNVADIDRAAHILNFKPTIPLNDGIKTFLQWAETRDHNQNNSYEKSIDELRQKGFMRS